MGLERRALGPKMHRPQYLPVAAECQDHQAWSSNRQRERCADAHVMADHLRACDPDVAGAQVTLADVEARALAHCVSQLAQDRLDDLEDIKFAW